MSSTILLTGGKISELVKVRNKTEVSLMKFEESLLIFFVAFFLKKSIFL